MNSYLDASQPLNENSNHELASATQKVKPSKLRSPSNAFQSRHRPCSSLDAIEINKVLLTEQALTEIMSQTLKHAASSMFVTSFTTAAAFCTNMLTNISFVQVFGVFTGTCILLYFVITVTAIAAFAVSSSWGWYSRETRSSCRSSTRNTFVICFPVSVPIHNRHREDASAV